MVAVAHCSTCGYPHDGGPACVVCGASLTQPGSANATLDPDPFKRRIDEVHPQLIAAFAAWKSRQHARYVGQSLAAIGLGSPIPTELADGLFWPINLGPALGTPVSICLGIDRVRDEVSVETPLVEIADGHVAPMLRASLELNAALPHGVRLSARRTRLVVRFVDAIAVVPPPRLLAVLRGTALLAKDLELVFRAQFPCRGLLEDVAEALRRGGVTSELRGLPVELALPSEPLP